MQHTHPVLDFINRTEKIIQQYDVLRRYMPHEKSYEVTLLINSLLGLLIIPQQIANREPYKQYMQHWLTDKTVARDGLQWDIRPEFVKCPGYTSSGKPIKSLEEMTMRQLIRQMRNTAAHYNLHILPDIRDTPAPVEIEAIRFQQIAEANTPPEQAEYLFKMELPVRNLKAFSLKLARETRRQIEKTLEATRGI